MPIRYSKGPIAYTTVRGDTSANLRADLDAVLLACAWKHVGPVTNGWVYQITSPEGLSCRVVIQDRGNKVGPLQSPCITVQFFTPDGATGGFSHNLIYGSSLPASIGYEVVVNQCQLFMAVPGWTLNSLPGLFDTLNFSVAGGIPALPPDSNKDCQIAAQPTVQQVTQIFWSCGTEFWPSANDFRNSRNCFQSFSWCLNGNVIVQAGGSFDPGQGMLCLFPLTQTDNVDTWFLQPARVLKYKTDIHGNQTDGDPLYIDALVGWRSQIQGQLWDAFQATRDEPLDSTLFLIDFDAGGASFPISTVAWNNNVAFDLKGGGGTYFCTLYLLTQPIHSKVQPANVHY